MKPRSLPLAFAVLVGSAVFGQAAPPAEPDPAGEGEKVENVEPAGGFVEVKNPAFPAPEVKGVSVHRGRRFDARDFAPYFAAGPLASAKALFDKGLYEKARAQLEGQGEGTPVRYLRALASLRGGDFARAAAEMPLLAKDYPPLSDRCLVHAGLAQEELKQWDAAAAAFAAVPPESRLYIDARLGLSRALHRGRDLAGAIAALEPLAAQAAPQWGRDVAAEALIATADLAREKKDPKAEKVALTRLWSLHPLSPLAQHAEQRLGGATKLPVEAAVARAEVQIDAHRNRLGLDVLEPLLPKLKLPDALACRAHFAYGKGLRKERQHTKAIAALDPVVEKCTDPDLRARAMYVLGSSRSISDLARAPAIYETLAKEFPAHSFADDALFFAADVYVKLGDIAHAVERLDQIADRYPTGDFAAEALFKSFWIQRSAGKYVEGLQHLDRIETLFAAADESYEVERARYWHARVFEEQGQKAQAAEILERLAVEHPATYYGLMARLRLASLDEKLAQQLGPKLEFPATGADPWPLFAGTMGESPHFLTGVELLRLGFPEAVSSELLAVPRANQPAESIRLLVMLLSAAGDQRSAHAVARVSLRRDLSGRITDENRPIWEVAFPNAFRGMIEKHCKAADDLDPDLLQALMREESALDPKALSWAGALGLTQLMPSTAAGIAAQLKLKGLTQKMILDPDINIRLGARYLGNLYKRYGGTKQLALAGYNAGQSAVDHWRQDRPKDELDVWVENIPIAETRGYVKRVLRSYNTYQLLYPKKKAAPPMTGER